MVPKIATMLIQQRTCTNKAISRKPTRLMLIIGSPRVLLNLIQMVFLPNSRRCFLYARLARNIGCIIKEALTSKFVKIMPRSGDTPILVAINTLANHGMTLVRVTQNFQRGCRAYNLLQISSCCRLVIVVRPWELKRPDYFTDHCVAWDGSILGLCAIHHLISALCKFYNIHD